MSGNGHAAAALLGRMVQDAPSWAVDEGPAASVVLSSRIRLARNLVSVPFPPAATPEQQTSVVNRLRRVIGDVDALTDATFIPFDDLDESDMGFLVERRLISRDLARGDKRRGVVVGQGETITVMVNEEDHYRLQHVVSGLRLGDALDRINRLDDLLDARLDYAFSEDLGFLTTCPTNVGTGMRASVLAHLPALVLTRRARKVMRSVTAMGLAVRGFYGEGTELMGNFFQISNQTTLGSDEHAIVSRLDEVVRQILGYEDEAREVLRAQARVELEDKVYRAYAILREARLISSEDVVNLASAVRFGIMFELPGLCPLTALNEILIFSQPGHVERRAGRALNREERRFQRAQYIRSRLAETGAAEPPAPRRGRSSDDSPSGS